MSWRGFPTVLIGLVCLGCFREEPDIETDNEGDGDLDLPREMRPMRLCGECIEDEVCCPEGNRCAGKCVPDCTLGQPCPSDLVCDEVERYCVEPNGAGGASGCTTEGSGEPCTAEEVCCPEGHPCAGNCVPDCRMSDGTCPMGGACDDDTGLCGR